LNRRFQFDAEYKFIRILYFYDLNFSFRCDKIMSTAFEEFKTGMKREAVSRGKLSFKIKMRNKESLENGN